MRVRVEVEGEGGIKTVFEREGDLLREDLRTVSYTHLTLPTKA